MEADRPATLCYYLQAVSRDFRRDCYLD